MAKYKMNGVLTYFRVVILLLSSSVKAGLVDFTCFNSIPVLSSSVNEQFIGGYKGNEVVDADVSFGRTIITGTGSYLPQSSCACAYVQPYVKYTRQYMKCPSGSCSCADSLGGTTDCLYRIGAFYCEIQVGTTTERITTITLNAEATIVPERQTITVNLGEPVTFSLSFPSGDISSLRWRRSSVIISAWNNNPSPSISAVTEEDAGVYECHEGGERGKGVHAILRLIVRGCASGRWGPSCRSVCPVCYNGGMCDTESGQCICAPGFHGSYCHIAAGSNKWGLNATSLCSSQTDRHGEACRGNLLCLQDPFGCACATGFMGIDCTDSCPPNTFGPYCSQTCHCATGIACLTDTGECDDPSCTADFCPQLCATEWKGSNCQVPTPCPVGFYGEICAQVCNCFGNEQCDDTTGECANGCQEGFIGLTCVEDGTRAITDLRQMYKPNERQPVTITCEAVGNPLPDPSHIVLFGTNNTRILHARTRIFDNLNSYKTTNEFEVDGTMATQGALFTCSVFSGTDDHHVHSQTLLLEVYRLPYLTSAPTVDASFGDPNQVLISWYPWSSDSGNGEGPVDRYIVYYRYASDVDAAFTFSESAGTSNSLVINGLNIDTEYDFVVVVARAGVGGAGRPSSKTTVRTKCGTPSTGAALFLSTLSGTELLLNWQLPPQSTWQCRSLDKIYIYSRLESESSFSSPIAEIDADVTEAVISSLMPCTGYSVVVTFTNRDGRSSPSSYIETETTDAAAPGPVQSLDVNQDTTGSDIQLRITWSAPTGNNCPVDDYIIQHGLTRVLACDADIESPHFEVQTTSITTMHLTNLLANSKYFVSVIARNTIGSSTYTPMYKTTSKKAPSFVPTVSVAASDVTSSGIRFTWNEYNCTELNGEFTFYNGILAKVDQQNGETVQSFNLNFPSLRQSRLDPCTRYRFKVAVKNDIGLGYYSDPVEVTTSSVVPNKVRSLTVNPVQGYPTILSLRWSKPVGECSIDFYTISYQLTNAFQCASVAAARNTSGTTMDTMFNITGLLPYSTYFVYVTASTPAGEGAYSYTRVATAEAAPTEPPLNVGNTHVVKRSLEFDWSPPPCRSRRGDITGYSYRLVNLDRDDNNIRGDTENTQVTIENLVPYTLYSFHVLARTAAGDGPYSQGLEVRTSEAKPPQVMMVSTPSGDATSITVEWHRPDPPHGIIIAYYVWYSMVTQDGLSDPGQSETVTDGLDQNVLQLVLTGLESNANFSIKVQAETSVAVGDPSTPIYRITKEGIPGPPSSLRIGHKTETELEIEWNEPMVTNGRIINYIIKYRPSFKPYLLDFTPPTFTRLPVSSPIIYRRVLLGLEPGTQYEIEVSAETSIGEGDPVSIAGFTKPKTDIPNPESPTLYSAKSTATAVVISISRVDNPYITSYMVWVKKVASRKKRQSGPNQQGESIGTFDENPDSYIAADIQKDDFKEEFKVGDNGTYNGYYNPPLEEGAMYEIRSGASSKADDAFATSWSSPLGLTVGKYYISNPGPESPTEDKPSSIGTIVAILVSVLLIVAAAGFLAMVVIKKRKSQGTGRPFDSIGMRNIAKETPRYTPAPTGPTQLKPVASEDALTNLNDKKPSEASTVMPESQLKPRVKKVDQTATVSAGPIKREQLKGYIKKKRAKTNEGYKLDYGSLPDGQIHSWDVARKEENKTKNRYANIIAYDHSRVVLDKLEGDDDSDYINACYIDGYNHPNKYIASQGPNQTSTNDMWRMVWQEKTSIIVMVTHLVEGGKKKCEQYWPTTSMHYGRIEVKLDSESKLADSVTRSFTLKKEGETRKLKQFHFTSWPDMGLPKYISPLLYFVYTVKASITPTTGPIIVHCSAGVGRTGTFITLDAMLDQAKKEGKIDVLKFVADMRDRRIKMVQTQDQYMFIFDALLEAFVFGQTWISVDDIRKEYDRLKTPSPHGNSSILEDEFNKLTALQSPAKGDRYRGGKDPLNTDKNRFPDCLPFDRCRPYLMTMGADHSTNYINASYINGYWKRDQYITTQLPLPSTSIDFWSMIYDYKSPTIVMLNPLDPDDQTMDRYWPEKTMGAFGPLNVHLVSADNEEGVQSRTFTIDNMNKPNDKPHTVRQFDFQGWSLDEHLPSSPVSILTLIYCVQRWHEKSQGGPLTVQCIDGVRCCGVFCAVLTMLDRIKTEERVDVFQAVRSVRNNRPSMVSSLEQYDFCYLTALRHLQSFDVYENFK
ncbi:receptor-type tyrosine-protein phosphatase T-like [Asterias amurensis]|uniref:receptor-type tyrosine-protein phosphatase T-like n=1 Tax=Asterias amurensis TaxID=7602 RepID=UPI003AB631D1